MRSAYSNFDIKVSIFICMVTLTELDYYVHMVLEGNFRHQWR
jgi:hypothetical protein